MLLTVIWPDAIAAMMIIRLAIGVFALALLGLAVSLSAAQNERETAAADKAALIHR